MGSEKTTESDVLCRAASLRPCLLRRGHAVDHDFNGSESLRTRLKEVEAERDWARDDSERVRTAWAEAVGNDYLSHDVDKLVGETQRIKARALAAEKERDKANALSALREARELFVQLERALNSFRLESQLQTVITDNAWNACLAPIFKRAAALSTPPPEEKGKRPFLPLSVREAVKRGDVEMVAERWEVGTQMLEAKDATIASLQAALKVKDEALRAAQKGLNAACEPPLSKRITERILAAVEVVDAALSKPESAQPLYGPGSPYNLTPLWELSGAPRTLIPSESAQPGTRSAKALLADPDVLDAYVAEVKAIERAATLEEAAQCVEGEPGCMCGTNTPGHSCSDYGSPEAMNPHVVHARRIRALKSKPAPSEHVAAPPPYDSICQKCGGDAAADELGPTCSGPSEPPSPNHSCPKVLVDVPTCAICLEQFYGQKESVLIDAARAGRIPCCEPMGRNTICALDAGHAGDHSRDRGPSQEKREPERDPERDRTTMFPDEDRGEK